MKRRGFSLAEILLAMAVAAMSVIGIATLIASIYRSVKEGKYQAVASTLARHELERLRGDKEDLTRLIDLAAAETKVHPLPVDNWDCPFNCTLRVVYMPTMQNRYVDATCLVRWEQQGRIRNITMETLLPQP